MIVCAHHDWVRMNQKRGIWDFAISETTARIVPKGSHLSCSDSIRARLRQNRGKPVRCRISQLSSSFYEPQRRAETGYEFPASLSRNITNTPIDDGPADEILGYKEAQCPLCCAEVHPRHYRQLKQRSGLLRDQ